MRVGSLNASDREALFDAVITDYLAGLNLDGVARARGIAHRTLQRFMTSHDRKRWLLAQDLKQWDRIEAARDRGILWDDYLYNSVGFRMDRIQAELRKAS